MKNIYVVLFGVSLFFFLKSVFTLLFKLENYKLHKERLDQLKFKDGESDEVKELIDKITQPIIKEALPRINLGNLEQIERDLKITGWNSKFTAKQYLATIYLGIAIGVIAFFTLLPFSVFMAFLWSGVLVIGPIVLLRSEAKSKREDILSNFPDFIRVTQGYLTAGYPLTKAIRESIPYVSKEWQPILESFVITAEMSGVEIALENMAIDADIFEAQEFVSLIRLTLEQGVSAQEGFKQQADKIQELLYDSMMGKIRKRAVYGVMVQGPLILCMMATFALPTLHSMFNIGG